MYINTCSMPGVAVARATPRARLSPRRALCAAGRCRSRARPGASYAMSSADDTDWQSLKRQEKGVVNLAVGHPHPAALPNAILARAFERAAAGLVAPSDESVGGAGARVPMSYVARRGEPATIRTLATFLSDAYSETASWSARPARHAVRGSELLLVAGASHGLDVACAALTKPGDVVVVETPSYFLAADVFADRGLRVVGVAGAGLKKTSAPEADETATDASFDVGALEDRLRDGLRPRLVYVVPTHGNPRSGTMSSEKRKRLLRLAGEYDFYVVADEVYHLLSWGKGERAPPPRFREVEREMRGEEGREEATGTTSDESDDPYAEPAEDENANAADDDDSRVASLGSFSKILAPGVRLGWIEAGPRLIRALADRGYLSSGGCVSPLAASVATFVIASGDQKTWLRSLRRRYASAAAVLADAVSRETASTGWRMRSVPSGGYFAWIELPETCDVDAFALEAKKEAVATLSGGRCVAGEADPDAAAACGRCVRVCFAYLDEDDIEEGVRRLACAVRRSVK